MLIERLLRWRDERSVPGRPRDEHSATNQLQERPSAQVSLLEKSVRWFNSFFFIIGATCWIVVHRRTIDIIHVHIADWIAGYAGWLGSCLGIPVVCKAADMPALPKLDRSIPLPRSWDQWRKRIRYVAMHEAIADELSQEGIPRDKIEMIPNGVEVPSCHANPSTGRYVLVVGNFTQGAGHKGFDILFRAWAIVSRHLTEAKLLVAGRGESVIWENMVAELGCSRSVKLAGYVQEMGRLYRDAALLVLPSRHEGMSNALLESQAWGLPAVVSAIPGNVAVIEHGQNGLVVPVGDHEALAEAIRKLLEDRNLRARMGMNARQRIMQSFSMESVSRSYLSYYSDVVRIRQGQ
jgi:glycosyltransferase involved in cell wall biosynthesis